MRKLHLVGLTADREGLVFTARSGSKAGGYLVSIDAKLLHALAEAGSAPVGAPAGEAHDVDLDEAAATGARAPAKAQSSLTPREIQARLRAGRSLEEVAEEAGVGIEWVERFALPIMAEQARVVALSRNLVYSKPRLGESSQPLAASVAWNLSERSVWLGDDVFDSCWGAYQLHDSVWILRFRYRSRGRQQDALWEVDLDTGRLVARNRLAAELGYVEKGRRRRDAADPGDEEAGGEAPAKGKAPSRSPSGKGRAAKAGAAKAGAAKAGAAKAESSKPATRSNGRSSGSPKASSDKASSTRVASSSASGRGRPARASSGEARKPAAAAELGNEDISDLSGSAPRFVPRPMPSDGGGSQRRAPRGRGAARSRASEKAAPSSGEVVKLPSSSRARPARRSP